MPRQKVAENKPVETADPMIDHLGKRKGYCVGCGGPRCVVYAETVTCFCCGSIGTQKKQVQFDQYGDPVAKEIPVQVENAPTVKIEVERNRATLLAMVW